MEIRLIGSSSLRPRLVIFHYIVAKQSYCRKKVTGLVKYHKGFVKYGIDLNMREKEESQKEVCNFSLFFFLSEVRRFVHLIFCAIIFIYE